MNSKEILISIIVPTYNRKELVIKLIDSLSNQKNKNFEIIVIDDGSTDDTYNILKKTISFKNFSIYRIENSERGAARNYGASLARGKYLNFFDSDDIALENHTKIASSKILELNNPPLFNLSYAYKFNKKIKNVVLSGKINNKIFSNNIISCNGVFIRKDIFEKNKFSENRDLSGSEDWHLWIRLAFKYEFISFKEITTHIIDNENRSMKTQSLNQVKKRIDILLKDVNNDFKNNIKFINLCKINSELYSFISMTASFYKNRKFLSFKYLIKAIFSYPFILFSRRSITLYYRLLFRW